LEATLPGKDHPPPAVILGSIGFSIMEKEVNDKPVRNEESESQFLRGSIAAIDGAFLEVRKFKV
jgi:hypothetical protein